MAYTNPRNIFQEKISKIIRKEKTNIGILEHIFKLQQIYSLERSSNQCLSTKEPDKNSWEVLYEVYSLLGKEKFAELVAVIHGRTLTFPTEEEYQDSLITALCYYYKEIEGMNLNQIKDKLEIPNLNTIKYGIKVRAFKGFIDSGILQRITK